MSEKEATKKAAEQPKTAPRAKAAEKHENVMYVGPSIPGVALQNTVYTEIPAGALEAAESCPALRNLFVAVMDYCRAEEMIRSGSGYIHSAFEAALKYKEERRTTRNA